MTTNVGFVPAEWGDARADAVRAVSYGRTDPRSCVFYARRVVEQTRATRSARKSTRLAGPQPLSRAWWPDPAAADAAYSRQA